MIGDPEFEARCYRVSMVVFVVGVVVIVGLMVIA